MKPNQTRDLIFAILYHHHRHLKPDQLRFLELAYRRTQEPKRPRQIPQADCDRRHILDSTPRLPTGYQRRIDAIVADLHRRGLTIPPPPKV